MARLAEANETYAVAESFRGRCLAGGRSLLWPDAPAWTTENLDRLWTAFVQHPDESKDKSFLEKWQGQLSEEPDDVCRIAADLLVLYHLINSGTKPETKSAEIHRLVSWRFLESPPELPAVEGAFGHGIADAGVYYKLHKNHMIEYFLAFAREGRQRTVDFNDREHCQLLADELQTQITGGVAARNALLHLLFPDEYEAIVSNADKLAISKHFAQLAGDADDLDEQLAAIWAALAPQYGPGHFRFYDPPVKSQWAPESAKKEEPAPETDTGGAVSFWIEKTHVRGRVDREGGPYQLGAALWSPQRSRGGTDVYRFMRDVRPGDVVLHLTDGEGFTGISRAASAYEDFAGVPDSEWGEQPHYIVWLEDFQVLDPTLDRSVLFSPPWVERLLALLDDGLRNTFYNREPSLNQGAYLTPAPTALVQILNDAYTVLSGSPLVPGFAKPDETPLAAVSPRPAASMEELVDATYLTRGELEELRALVIEKKHVILEGPPGSGKTFVADRFARHFTGNSLDARPDDRLTVVQFHQSYGYEDFVQGIRPRSSRGVLHYDVQDGVFKRVCALAETRPDERFVLLIDEINRGNIARIFGELLFLLEYRDESIELAYSESGASAFSIPQNVYLLATMNTTDRSLAQLDYALRRRFYFYRLMPVVGSDAPVLRRWLERTGMAREARQRVLSLFLQLNARIRAELDEHFQVGHSYFMHPDIDGEERQARVWRRQIMPLLEEYFYNRQNLSDFLQQFERESLLADLAALKPDAD